jgi:hypothetical protein
LSAWFTEPRSADAVTDTAASCTVAGASAMLCSTARPAATLTPVTVFAWKPMRRTTSVAGPAGTPPTTNRPSTPDSAPSVVPSTRTCTSEMPAPVFASTTRPTMRPVRAAGCAAGAAWA